MNSPDLQLLDPRYLWSAIKRRSTYIKALIFCAAIGVLFSHFVYVPQFTASSYVRVEPNTEVSASMLLSTRSAFGGGDTISMDMERHVRYVNSIDFAKALSQRLLIKGDWRQYELLHPASIGFFTEGFWGRVFG